MKGDFSRLTFRREKHYDAVLVQQGRVELDADFNEQQAITRYRAEIEARDVIGRCGTPIDPSASGFEIVAAGAPATSFTIGAGRYYVDGILCENETQVDYLQQPEYPAASDVLATLAGATLGLVYLDVWRRHVTLLEDPSIHEPALGLADTTTRVKTTWQVKILPLASAAGDGAVSVTCASKLGEWDELTSGSGQGRLTATAGIPAPAVNPCLPPPGAGYLGLENQLYRAEIHDGGDFPGGSPTLKWSRENGSLETRVLDFDATDPSWITVHDLGKDSASLGFVQDGWVELVNEHTELASDGAQLGFLTTIKDIRVATNSIQLADVPPPAAPASLQDLTLNPRLRRWDQVTLPPIPADPGPPATIAVAGVTPDQNGIAIVAGQIPLEDGIAVSFGNGHFRPGDYWMIPARTAIGDIEWPQSGGVALPLPPLGIEHHYCRLALIAPTPDGTGITVVSDCRNVFPPLTGLENLFYLGGDGQEVMPVPPDPVALPEPLVVGVSRGKTPVAGATVRFEVLSGGGTIEGLPGPIELTTGADGTVSCAWSVASDLTAPQQQVRATLLDGAGGNPVHLPVTFTAQFNLASEVYFEPECDALAGANTVSDALDKLCGLVGNPATPAIRIKKVVLTAVASSSLKNDSDVAVPAFARGITVFFDGQIDPLSLHATPTINNQTKFGVFTPACFVTIFLPWPLGAEAQALENPGLVGYQPIVLDGTAKVAANGAEAVWVPGEAAAAFLDHRLFAMVKGDTRVLARFTLKGSFVHSPVVEERPVRFVDGEPLGPVSSVGRNPESGDGEPGGDFELWVWLRNG